MRKKTKTKTSSAKATKVKKPKGAGEKSFRRDSVTYYLSPCEKYYYDPEAADRGVTFFSKYVRHSKGEWAGQPLELEPWQKDEIIRPAFGWFSVETQLRRYTTIWVEVPRKNGKSTLAGGVALLLLKADGEPGAEVYSAAADKVQAGIVFSAAKAMVENSPALSKRLTALRQTIYDKKDDTTYYRVLSADAFRQHGLNPHGIIFDEVHTQPNRDLWEVLDTATGSRRQPMTFAITTAGFDTDSICYELHEYARQIKEGIIKDDTWLVVMYGAKETDDWTDEEVWKKANPNYGISIKPEYMRKQCEKAKKLPRFENTFKRLHLNIWTSQETRWIPMLDWDECDGAVDWEMLKGLPCYAAIDLSSTTDLTALVLVFRVGNMVKLLPYFWIPEENVRMKGDANKVNYEAWVRSGHLETTEGNVVDYEAVFKKLEWAQKTFDIREVPFDRWNIARLLPYIARLGLQEVAFGQGFKDMSAPSKNFEELVLSHRIAHGGHPILRWNADNVVVVEDPAGNIKPDKKKSKKKIDGIVAGIMGIGRAFAQEDAKQSPYAKRGSFLTV